MPPRPQMKRPVAPTARTAQVPAPVGGVNTVASGISLPHGDCAQAYNLLAAENGLRVRLGSSEWATNLTGSSDNGVRSLLPFTGASTLKLWAATNTGLWDVTDSSTAPTRVVTFPSSAGNSGYGVSCVVVSAGGHHLLYADEANGLYRYAEAGGTWTKVGFGGGAGQIAGVDPASIVFVTTFKGRVWMVERDTDSAWYLPTGAIAGTASEFPMGMSFKTGGTLVGLWSWTYDGGAGVDDSLVALATGGDVLVYQGTDPASSSTFALKGVWYAGPPPAGRLVATSTGGEVLLITRQGVLPISKLVVGADALSEATTFKISNLLNGLMAQRADARGWCLVQHPEEPALVLLVPRGTSDFPLQLVQATGSRGWFPWRDLDMTCAVSWDKRLYFGTSDGRVLTNTGYVDGVSLSDPNDFAGVDWSLLTASSDLGSPTQKQVGLVRPIILSDNTTPAYAVEARYGYSQAEVDPVSLVAGTGSLWDSDVWDAATWAGDSTPSQETRGTAGMGSDVAIAMRGTAVSRTVLVGFAITYTSGGFL